MNRWMPRDEGENKRVNERGLPEGQEAKKMGCFRDESKIGEPKWMLLTK